MMREGFKLVAVDLTTDDHNGGRFRYTLGAEHVADPGDREFSRDPSACPLFPGDGLCVAQTLTGASSEGHRVGASAMLLVEFDDADVLAETADKVLVSRLRVTELVDPVRLLEWATLTRANLTRANLTRANLTRAHLTEAHLTEANLTEAHLTRANLTRANLTRAHLTRAHLEWANLTRANLTRANLTRANLTGAIGDEDTVLPDGWTVNDAGQVVEA